ncbi:MAG: methyltransferase [Devosia sp.]
MSLDHATANVKRQSATGDAFLGGRLTIAQPQKGFRAGLDSVLLGAAVSPGSTGLLDLGAGVGTAGMVALATNPGLHAALVEFDLEMLVHLRSNIAANGLAAQARAIELDLTLPAGARTAAGLEPDHYTSVIANPPFYEQGQGSAPSKARAAARHMPAKALDLWVKTAASHAAPGGEIIFIHLAERLGPLLTAFEARFGAVTVLPLTPRPGGDAHRVLIRAIKGSRAPLTLLASRPLHLPEGRAFQPDFEVIFRGEDRLHW